MSQDTCKRLCMLELYAGIGGMRTAATVAGLPITEVHPFEINPNALEVYCHNFSGADGVQQQQQCSATAAEAIRNGSACEHLSVLSNELSTSKGCKKLNKTRNLLGLSVAQWTKLDPDILTMSPPCQPFTRQGRQLDTADPRHSSLHHVVNTLLSSVPRPPRRLLLENVAGFEVSQARDRLLCVLRNRGYHCKEYLLCPSQLGVPNSRLRYYLLAVLLRTATCPSDERGRHEKGGGLAQAEGVVGDASATAVISCVTVDDEQCQLQGIENVLGQGTAIDRASVSVSNDDVEATTVTALDDDAVNNCGEEGSSPCYQEEVSREFPVCLCLPWTQRAHLNSLKSVCGRCNKKIIHKVSHLLYNHHSSTMEEWDVYCIHKQNKCIKEIGEYFKYIASGGSVVACDWDVREVLPAAFADLTPWLSQYLQYIRNCTCDGCSKPCSVTDQLREECIHCMRELLSNKLRILPPLTNIIVECHLPESGDLPEHCRIDSNSERDSEIRLDQCQYARYRLQEKQLVRYARLLDIVDDTSRRTCCFTKAYGRLLEGTGSVFNPRGRIILDDVFAKLDVIENCEGNRDTHCDCIEARKNCVHGNQQLLEEGPTCYKNVVNCIDDGLQHELSASDTSSMKDNDAPKADVASTISGSSDLADSLSHDTNSRSLLLQSLHLRYFSPAEGLRLMSYPSWYTFPPSLSPRTQYQLLGNSVNVLVVAVLLTVLEDMWLEVQQDMKEES